MSELQQALNQLAGTIGLDAQGAANVWCGYAGPGKLELMGALNDKAQSHGLELEGVLNRLAGTTGLGANGAISALLAADASGHQTWAFYSGITWTDLADDSWGDL